MQLILMVVYVVALWIGLSAIMWGFLVLTIKRSANLIKKEAFDVKIKDNSQLIDVRESSAFKVNHITGFRNMPFQNFMQGKAGLRLDKDIIIVDQDMRTASRVLRQLKKQGYAKEHLFVLNGGLKNYFVK